ncbi:MAG TPA: D-alanyl-D-alanine carboxypeptidase, partial [Paracoccaceae bacterium]|nr:D-alanyl-D-alanine carboxypeptidase [Paracoccaceae bacterium]
PILQSMLKYSTNLTAEITGAAAANIVGAKVSTLLDSTAVMGRWASELAGFPREDPGFRFVNHSGLTLESRVSPERMVDLLAALARADGGAATGLPHGIARYLDRRVVENAPPGLEVAAKSGTMSFVRGLAGYALTPGGRRLAFAIFSNDLAQRGDGPEKVNRPWLNRARSFEQALLRRWAMQMDAS